MEEVEKKLIAKLKEYRNIEKKQKIVISVDGSPNSALVCYLMAKVFGPRNVYAYSFSSKEKELGPVLNAVKKTGFIFETMNDMKSISYLASLHNAVIAGSSDKTDLLTGKFNPTGSVFPLADVYKSEIQKLCNYLGFTKIDEEEISGTLGNDSILKEYFEKARSKREIQEFNNMERSEIDKVIDSGVDLDMAAEATGFAPKLTHHSLPWPFYHTPKPNINGFPI